MTARRSDAALPARLRRTVTLPEPNVKASTFSGQRFDQQLDEIDTVTNDVRKRIQNQTKRIARIDSVFQILVPRIQYVLTVMLENHTRDVNDVAVIFQGTLDKIQKERDDIAARATLSMERLQTLSDMQVRFVTDMQKFIKRLDDKGVANKLSALLWDEEVVNAVPEVSVQMENIIPVDQARHFIQAWNARLAEARQEAAAFGNGQSVLDYLKSQQKGRNANKKAEWAAIIAAFALVYALPIPIEEGDADYQPIKQVMQETPADALIDCEQFIDHPKGLIIKDVQNKCHDLVSYAEQTNMPNLVNKADIMIIGYDLISGLLKYPGQPVPYDPRAKVSRATIGRPQQ